MDNPYRVRVQALRLLFVFSNIFRHEMNSMGLSVIYIDGIYGYIVYIDDMCILYILY